MNALSALCLGLQLAAFHGPVEQNPANLAPRAEAILRANCFGCHGQEGKAKGGFSYVLDRDRLLARNKIVSGDSNSSEIYLRVQRGEMPPRSQEQRLTAEEIALLRRWIDAGAPAVAQAAAPRSFITDEQVHKLILADLQQLPAGQQRFFRYFSLVPLWNADRPQSELEMVRQGLSKLLNSLSWHPRVTKPQAVDAAETIYRIDLRAYQWTAHRWDQLAAAYPYRFGLQTPESRQLVSTTGSDWFCLRADWFLATASRPPLYQDLLQLPFTDRDLERQLRVDVLTNIDEETAVRAGFNESGVSRNNRILERHDAAFGAYWRSYDFNDSGERQNIFEHPLGPAPGRDAFSAAGGEIIFHLPNGLQGFMLVDRAGRRIDRAPIEIVSDPKRSDRVVETGISCFSCHLNGFFPKADQVRGHVEKNSQAFSKRDVASVKALYVPEAKFRKWVEEDNGQYQKAVKAAGVRLSDDDPVSSISSIYEATLDAPRAAAELGMTPEDFLKKLADAPALTRALGAVRVKQGAISRQAFLAALPEIIREFRLDDSYRKGEGSTTVVQPFAGHTQGITSLAIAPDGAWAISGSEDRTIHLWDLRSGREKGLFEGHAGAVLALAVAADQKLFASAGQDRTVRIWDVKSGKEILQLRGHTAAVRALAFSPDGAYLASGGQDKTLRLWKVETGEEVHGFAGHTGTITALAFAPDGKTIGSTSLDRTARLWDAGTGVALRTLEENKHELYAVTFSPDGGWLATGGNDGKVRIWSVKDGKLVHICEGHVNPVVQLSFSADSKGLLSAVSGSQNEDGIRLWDVETGKQKMVVTGEKGLKVSAIAFSRDRRTALSGDGEGAIKLWKLELK